MTERRPDTTKSTSILAIVFFQEEKNLKKSEEILEIYRAYTAQRKACEANLLGFHQVKVISNIIIGV